MGFVATSLKNAIRMIGATSRPILISSKPIKPWSFTQVFKFSDESKGLKLLNPTDYPPIDWLKVGAVTEAKYQLDKGSCWAYVSVGAMEGLVYIKTKQSYDLSVQFLVDRFGDGPDEGGEAWYGFILAQVCNAWPLQKEYGNKRLTIRQVCDRKLQGIKLPITGLDFLSDPGDIISLVNRLYIQPVAVGVNDSSEMVAYKKGQVIRNWSEVEEYEDVDILGVKIKMKFKQPHSLLLVGFNYTENLEPYWVLRENAGPSWGENGCARVLCSLKIFDEAVWPVGSHQTERKPPLPLPYQARRFRKAQCPVMQRLTSSLMMHGRNNEKKVKPARIVKQAMEIIHLLTGQNPIQVIVDAVINSGPREDATRSTGVVRRQSVDISPWRRVNQAMYLLTTGACDRAVRNNMTISEGLAYELINAAKRSSNMSSMNKNGSDVKLFNRWSYDSVKVGDIFVRDYVSAGKAQCPVVERLTTSLVMHGPKNGKKLMGDAMEIIYLLTGQNPIQVIYDAVMNSCAGVVKHQAVNVCPLKRLNRAIYLLSTGAHESFLRNNKTVAECLAAELINAAKGSSNSYAIKKKDEIEKVAKAKG